MSMGNTGNYMADKQEVLDSSSGKAQTIGEKSKYYKRMDRKGQEAYWMTDNVFRVTIVPGLLGGTMASLESLLSSLGVPNLWAISSYEDGSENGGERPELTNQASHCTQAYFTEASGMAMEFDYTPYTEGGSTVKKYFYKGPKQKTLTFKYGMIVNSSTTLAVQSWILAQRHGIRLMFHGTIELLSPMDWEVRRTWTFMNARLVSYEAAGLKAGKNTGDDIIETLKFTYNGCY